MKRKHKATILLLGPSLEAVSGVSTHLKQLFGSELSEIYELIHFQVGSEGRGEGILAAVARYGTSPFSLLACLLRLKPDIMHVNSSLDPKSFWRDMVYVLIGKIARVKIVYQVHGGELPERFLGTSAIANHFLRWSLGLPAALVLLANTEKEAYSSFGQFRKLVVIPNAVQLQDYKNIMPKRFDRDELVLGYIGRLANDKGIKESIEAFDLLRNRGVKQLRFVIAGSGPEKTHLRRLVAENALEKSVTFLPPVFGKDQIDFWRQIDLFLFPTYHREGLPYTVLESIASGTPIVTTRIGGIPDVIDDGKQGLFVDAHSVEQVADAVASLVNDREKLRLMSVAARDRAREYYGVERLASQFSELYCEVLS